MTMPVGVAMEGGRMVILGWTLLHSVWQDTLVALLLWCGLMLLEGRSARVRYGLCCAALGTAVVLPAATFLALGGWSAGSSGTSVVAGWVLDVQAVAGGGSSWSERAIEALVAAAPVLPWIWMAGVMVCAGRLGMGLAVVRKTRRVGVRRVDGDLVELFGRVAERLGVRRVVRLLESTRVDAPAMVGWLRPAVLLPVGCFAGLSLTQMEALLAHELAHIRRHDYLVSVAQSVAEALLFYHPAVWWVSRQVRRERECCCDEIAAEIGGDRLEYARALSRLEEDRALQSVIVLGANGGVLTMRIKRVLGYREGNVAAQAGAIEVLGALVLSAGVLAVRAHASPTGLMTQVMKGPGAAQSIGSASSNFAQQGADGRSAPAASSGPISVRAEVMARQVLKQVPPVYPAAAKAAGVQGTVVLKAIITKTGAVEDLQVVSGPEELRAGSVDAVRQWKYKPYLLNGQPVNVDTTIHVNYVLAAKAGAAREGAPIELSAGMARPTPIRQMPPEYSPEARAAKIQGVVVLKAVISKAGIPEELQVVSGPKELATNAMNAVQQWRYKPYLLNGKPVAVATMIEVKFAIW